MKRIIILALAIAALSVVAAGTADACSLNGEIVRVSTTPGAGGTTIWIRTSSLAVNTYVATTVDLKIAEMAASAAANRNRVGILAGTSTSACPSPVAGAQQGIGPVLSFTLHP